MTVGERAPQATPWSRPLLAGALFAALLLAFTIVPAVRHAEVGSNGAETRHGGSLILLLFSRD
jgi:hypothetical protein